MAIPNALRPAFSLFFLLFPALATAGTIYVDIDASGANDGSSWADGYRELVDAINAASSGDEIWVAEGRYIPDPHPVLSDPSVSFEMKTGVGIYGGFKGTETALDQRRANPEINGTVLAESWNIVEATGVDATAILDGFTIENADSGNAGTRPGGGGMYCASASPTIRNCLFQDNWHLLGGGVFCGTNSSPSFERCTFRRHTYGTSGSVGSGGAVYMINATPVFTGCRFEYNNAGLSGGAIYATQSDPLIFDCEFHQNDASLGGAIYIDGSGGGLTRIEFCEFTNNIGSRGGALYFNNSSPQVLFASMIENGISGGGGVSNFEAGSVYNAAGASPTFSNCTISGSISSGVGGAVSNRGSSPIFKNCVIEGCSSTSPTSGAGGGMYNDATSSPELINCTFQGCVANSGTGGALFNEPGGSPVLRNCILWNSGGRGLTPSISGTFDCTFFNCLVEDLGAGSLNGAGSGGGGNLSGAGGANDPLFATEAAITYNADLDRYSRVGPVGDSRLTVGSPAIDSGSNAAAPAGVDLDGAGRINDGDGNGSAIVDLGAYEFYAPLYVDHSATGTDDGSSWQDAFTDLQSALAVADGTADIWVSGGTYKPTSTADRTISFDLKDGVRIYGGFVGVESSRGQRRFGNGSETILSGEIGGGGSSDNSYHVVSASGAGIEADAVLDGFTITAGYATGANPDNLGGGLHCEAGASPTILRCRFEGNYAGSRGGAVSNRHSSAPTLANCVFAGNSSGENGGAIYNFVSSPLIINATLAGNNAAGRGGAIFNNNNASPEIVGSVAWDNRADGATTAGQNTLFNTSSSSTTVTYSLLEHFDGPVLHPTNLDGTSATNDPQFTRSPSSGDSDWKTLGDNDYGDLLPALTSPILDQGDNSALNSIPDAGSIDVAGQPRAVNGDQVSSSVVDMGAYEAQRFTLYVDKDATGAGNGSSWADAFTELRDALAIAIPDDEIWVADGVYTPTSGDDRTISFEIDDDGLKIYGGFSGTETALSQRNPDPASNGTVLSGDIDAVGSNFDNTLHVVRFSGGVGPGTILDGFTISDGKGSGVDPGGAGLFCDFASPTVSHCRFLRNESPVAGGAMYLRNSGIVVRNCSFSENESPAYGAFHADEGTDARIEDTLFFANMGGAGLVDQLANVTIVNSVFSGHDSRVLFLAGVDSLLVNCTFSGNSSVAGNGTVAHFAVVGATVKPRLVNCILWGNVDGGDPASPTASFNDVDDFEIDHCLAENLDLTAVGTGNLDGTLSANAPEFARAVNVPAGDPGSLRLLGGSPGVDAGDSSANLGGEDIDGRPRIEGTAIDMGAYEGAPHALLVDIDATGANDGSSWADAFTDLQDALSIAQPGEEIWVARGTYKPTGGTNRNSRFLLRPGVGIYGGFVGVEAARGERGVAFTALSGDIGTPDVVSDNSRHVVFANGVGPDAVLDGFHVQHGNVGGGGSGAGFYCDGGAPTIAGCTFLANQADYGGAIYLTGSNAIISDCLFASNSATEGGGCILVDNASAPRVTDCMFRANSADRGAGIDIAPGSTAVIRRCYFLLNRVPTSAGGAHLGGGLRDRGGAHLIGSVFFGNGASRGGGAYFDNCDPVVENCTFAANFAGEGGGGVGGIAMSAVFANCVIWDNASGTETSPTEGSAESSLDNFSPSSTTSFIHCAFQNYTAADYAAGGGAATTGNLDGTNPASVRFVVPPDSGDGDWATTHDNHYGILVLALGSLAIDSGDNTYASEAIDIHGQQRIQNGTVDIGAYEGGFAPIGFDTLHSGIGFSGDENGNGICNYVEYALGGDPQSDDDPAIRPSLSSDELVFSRRQGVSDVFPVYQYSTDLVTWQTMVEGVHYEILSTERFSGLRLEVTLELLNFSADERLFYKQSFPL